MPLVLIPLLNNVFNLNIGTDVDTERNVAALVLLSTTLLSIFGVRLVAIVNNTGVVFEILGMVVFALILVLFYHHQSVSVFTDISYLGAGQPQAGIFLAAMFMSLFVIYGFDTASTLAEETKNPRREAPRAVLAAIIGAAIIGAIFLFAVDHRDPRRHEQVRRPTSAAGKHPFPLVTIIEANFPGWAANLYLFVVFAAIYVCCLAIQTSTIRLAFGMARDGKLPFGQYFNHVQPRRCTRRSAPASSSACSPACPSSTTPASAMIAIGATGHDLPLVHPRQHRHPPRPIARLAEGVRRPFRLGQWGTIVNILGLVWGVAMEINFLWPRDVSGRRPEPAPQQSCRTVTSLGLRSRTSRVYEFTLAVILAGGRWSTGSSPSANAPETPAVPNRGGSAAP